MYTTRQIVSNILDKMGYKKISQYVFSELCNDEEINYYIKLIKIKKTESENFIKFIDYFL